MRHLFIFFTLTTLSCGQAPKLPENLRTVRNQDYVGNGNKRQMLDLYLPAVKPDKALPLVVYIHGGGWESGSKENPGVLFNFLNDGKYAGASVNYRLSAESVWPAQIHDVKAAIRWLRAHANEHGIDKDRIAVFGISAGGHLVSMLGVTGGVKEFEGDLGPNSRENSRVTCVLDFCGPSDFLTFGGKGSIINPDDPASAIGKLIGGPVKEKQDTARSVSPVTHISSDDAPFLIIHGDKDTLVPYAQAQELDEALGKAKVPATLITGSGGPHVFFNAEIIEHMRHFLDKHLLGKDISIPETAIKIQ